VEELARRGPDRGRRRLRALPSGVEPLGTTVLIVDDSDSVREKTRSALGLLPTCETVLEADNGLTGLKLLGQHKVDLVLCDVVMPEIDGFKFLQLMKAKAEFRDIPVILLTGEESTDKKVRGLEYGAADYVTKPFEASELLARVKVQLKMKSLQDELKEKNSQLERLAATDSLTQLHNRRFFMEVFMVEFAKCERFHHDLGLLLIDIDHFKSVNDTWGHPEGDRVLVEVSTVLIKNVRKVDLVARFGGEEFVVMLPSTDLKGSKLVGEKLRTEVARQVQVGGAERRAITISAGLAHIPTTPGVASSDDLISRADEALYRSKESGRNRLSVAGE
jgi:diguanylate cyclase (GGDEF)-like protein